MISPLISMDLVSLRAGYQEDRFKPAEVVREVWKRIRERGERPVWIHLIAEEQSLARAEALGPFREELPLYGIPFAIKDNIDLAGVPTTAACPEYAYTPHASATVVDRLMAAGASADRQNESRSICHRPGGHSFALWRLLERLR